MKIYLIIGHINLVQAADGDWIRIGENYNNPDFFKGLNPVFRYEIKEYDVIKKTKHYYVRKNDGSYSEIFTHKQYKKDYEYDYEDEVLNHPWVREQQGSYEITVTMPTTFEGIEEGKKIIAKEISSILFAQIARANKLLESVNAIDSWEQYEAHYDWEEEDD